MYKVVILPVAKQDIKEAAYWYNSKQSQLGKRFTSQIRQKISFLKHNPEASAVRYDEVKTAVVEVFPFMIHYLVNKAQKLITIVAVLHTSRNPDVWKEERANPDISE